MPGNMAYHVTQSNENEWIFIKICEENDALLSWHAYTQRSEIVFQIVIDVLKKFLRNIAAFDQKTRKDLYNYCSVAQ